MKTIKSAFTIAILLLVQITIAQEWSSRITIMEEHLSEINFTEEQAIPNELQLALVQDDGDVFTISNQTFSTGINIMFEEVLESGFLVKDMLVYSISMSYDIGRFGLSFSFENFLNAGQQESAILPIPEYVGQDVINAVTYELDSPYAVAIGITYSF